MIVLGLILILVAAAAVLFAVIATGTLTATVFQSKVTVAERDVTATGCATPAIPPIPCVSATQGSFTATSKKIRIRI